MITKKLPPSPYTKPPSLPVNMTNMNIYLISQIVAVKDLNQHLRKYCVVIKLLKSRRNMGDKVAFYQPFISVKLLTLRICINSKFQKCFIYISVKYRSEQKMSKYLFLLFCCFRELSYDKWIFNRPLSIAPILLLLYLYVKWCLKLSLFADYW